MSLSALIAGGANLVGTGINAATSWYNRQADLELLKYQNKYNSPLEQMKRGIEAGINPNALAQGIAGSPGYGNMAAADTSSVSNAMPYDLGSQIGQSVNSALNAELLKANIAKTKEETRGMKGENDFSDVTFDSRVQQALDSGAITHAEAEKARELAERYPEMLDLSIEQAYADLDKTNGEISKISKDIDKIDQDIKESNKRIDKLEQDIRTGKSQEIKNYAETALTKEKETNQKLLNDKQEMENHREELTGDATGWKAVYYDKMDKEGKDAADDWLNGNLDAVSKVVKNSSKASAKGSQEVFDDTPQGQLKKMYQNIMNNKLAAKDKEIAEKEEQLRTAVGRRKTTLENELSDLENQKESIVREYRDKIRRVDKGSSVGATFMGTGANFGG